MRKRDRGRKRQIKTFSKKQKRSRQSEKYTENMVKREEETDSERERRD